MDFNPGRGGYGGQFGRRRGQSNGLNQSRSSSSLFPPCGTNSSDLRRQCNVCVHKVCDLVSNFRPEKSIGFICTMISSFEEHYGLEHKDEVREMALETIQRFGPGTPFESDERMLPIYKILGKYSRSMSSTDIYDRLYEKGLFTNSAKFFWDWSNAYVMNNDIERAGAVLKEMERCLGQLHGESQKMRQAIDQQKIDRAIAKHKKTSALVREEVDPQSEEYRRHCDSTSSLTSNTTSGALRGASTDSSRPASAESDPSDAAPFLLPVAPQPVAHMPTRRALFPVAVAESPNAPFVLPPTPFTQAAKEPRAIQEREVSHPTEEADATDNEPIVLPVISEAPPVPHDLVSPLVNFGAQTRPFSLAPIFSFAPGGEPLSEDKAEIIVKSVVKDSDAKRMDTFPNPYAKPFQLSRSNNAAASNGEKSVFKVPHPPNYTEENKENIDPHRGNEKMKYPSARRNLTGILLPSAPGIQELDDSHMETTNRSRMDASTMSTTAELGERSLTAYEKEQLERKLEQAMSQLDIGSSQQAEE